MLGTARLWAGRLAKIEKRSNVASGSFVCIYRLLARLVSENEVELEVRHINSDDEMLSQVGIFEHRLTCPIRMNVFHPSGSISQQRFDRINAFVTHSWVKLVLSCQPYQGARSQLLFSRFERSEEHWPSARDLEGLQSPWQYDGPLCAISTGGGEARCDFFFRYCGFTPSPDIEDDHMAADDSRDDIVSISSSAASQAARLARRTPTPRNIPTALLKPPGQEVGVESIPLSKRALAVKFAWSESEGNKRFEAVRNAFRRQLKAYLIPADTSLVQHTLRMQYLTELSMTIQASTNFVPLAEVQTFVGRWTASPNAMVATVPVVASPERGGATAPATEAAELLNDDVVPMIE